MILRSTVSVSGVALKHAGSGRSWWTESDGGVGDVRRTSSSRHHSVGGWLNGLAATLMRGGRQEPPPPLFETIVYQDNNGAFCCSAAALASGRLHWQPLAEMRICKLAPFFHWLRA